MRKLLSWILLFAFTFQPLHLQTNAYAGDDDDFEGETKISNYKQYASVKKAVAACNSDKAEIKKQIDQVKADIAALKDPKIKEIIDCRDCCDQRANTPDECGKKTSFIEIYNKNLDLITSGAYSEGDLKGKLIVGYDTKCNAVYKDVNLTEEMKSLVANKCKVGNSCQIIRPAAARYTYTPFENTNNETLKRTGGSCGALYNKELPISQDGKIVEKVKLYSVLLPPEGIERVTSCGWVSNQERIKQLQEELTTEIKSDGNYSLTYLYNEKNKSCGEISKAIDAEDCEECIYYDLQYQATMNQVKYYKSILGYSGGGDSDFEFTGGGGININMPQQSKLQQMTPLLLGGMGVIAGGLNGFFNYKSNKAWANSYSNIYNSYIGGYNTYATGAQQMGIPYYPPQGPANYMQGGMMGMMGSSFGIGGSPWGSALGGALGGMFGGMNPGFYMGANLGGYNPYSPFAMGMNPGMGMGMGMGLGLNMGVSPYMMGGMNPMLLSGMMSPGFNPYAMQGFNPMMINAGFGINPMMNDPFAMGMYNNPMMMMNGSMGMNPMMQFSAGLNPMLSSGLFPYGSVGLGMNGYMMANPWGMFPQGNMGINAGLNMGINPWMLNGGTMMGQNPWSYTNGGIPPMATPPFFPNGGSGYPYIPGTYPGATNGFPGVWQGYPGVASNGQWFPGGPYNYNGSINGGIYNNPGYMNSWNQSMMYQQQQMQYYQQQMQNRQYYSQEMGVLQQQISDSYMRYQMMYQQMNSQQMAPYWGPPPMPNPYPGPYNPGQCPQGMFCGNGGTGWYPGYNQGNNMYCPGSSTTACYNMGVYGNYNYGYQQPNSCGAGQAMAPTGFCVPLQPTANATNPTGGTTGTPGF